jgi:hypothetical protein
VPPIAEAEVRVLVDQWADSQNRGDFAAYERLYAGRFLGVRRSASRTFRSDRAGWLADRRRMFQRAIRVEAANVRIETSPDAAVVEFVQTWESAGYRDQGPKRLVLVREGGALRIAREEMLASSILGTSAGRTPLTPGVFFFVLDAGGPAVVLDAEAEEAWARGEPALVRRSGPALARRDVGDGLPAALAAWRGHRVHLYGERGRVCRATIDRLELLARVEPHFGTVEHWRGADGGAPVPETEIARSIWDMAGEQGRHLVGRVRAEQGTCDQALWARSSAQAEPAIFVPEEVAGPLAEKVVRRFRTLREYRTLQEMYLLELAIGGTSALWENHDRRHRAFRAWRAARSDRVFVTREVGVGLGCGEFTVELSAVFEAVGADLVLRSADSGFFHPVRAVFDLDGDGDPEFLAADGATAEVLLRRGGPALGAAERVAYPFLDCGC